MVHHEIQARFGEIYVDRATAANDKAIKELADFINKHVKVYNKIVDASGMLVIGHSDHFAIMTSNMTSIPRYKVVEKLDFVSESGKKLVIERA